MPANEPELKKNVLFTSDGLEIEGYGPGGIVTIVKKENVQIVRDMGEFLTPCIVIIAGHIIYAYTGNVMFLLWIAMVQVLSSHFMTEGEEFADPQNISRQNEKTFMQDNRFWIPLYLAHAVETATWLWALILMSENPRFESFYLTKVRPKTNAQYFAFSMVFGFLSSVNAAVGHELVHKREMHNKILGMLSYTKFFYSHFVTEHTEGHHKNMGTPNDPATANKNESLYMFLCREVYGTHKQTWIREKKRIQRTHGQDAPFIIILINNKMTYMFLLHVTLASLIYFFLGWRALKHQFVYAAWGVFYFEFLNYIEHYGLQRKKDKNGIYESISKLHSWNAVSSPLLFKVQRHSDHHIASFRPYQVLRRFDEAPWHPFQYMTCLWVSFVPPLWYYCINPRVDAIHDLQMGKKDNKTCWNNMIPLTEHDKKIKKIAWVYNFILMIIFGYFSLFSTTFSCFY